MGDTGILFVTSRVRAQRDAIAVSPVLATTVCLKKSSHLSFAIIAQSNFCSALHFVYPKTAPNSPEQNALTARFRESYINVSISRESKRLKKSSSWLNSDNALMHHLGEKCNFSVSPFC